MEKIAFVCPRTPRESYAGIENYSINLCKELKRRKYAVEMYCTAESPKKGFRLNGVKLHEFSEDKLPFGMRYYSKALVEALKKSDARIIHAAGYNTLAPLMAIRAKKPSQRLVVTLGSSKGTSIIRNLLEKVYATMFRAYLGRIDCMIAISESEKKVFQKKFPGIEISVIPVGHEKAKKLKVVPKSRQLITIGRLVKNKGFDHVLNAFKEVVKTDPEFRLMVIGNGPLRKGLEEMAKRLGVADKVNFMGSIPYKDYDVLLKHIAESTAFIFMSSYESQAIVIEEAVCLGVPTIVSNKSIMQEYADSRLAYSFDQDDSKGIAKKIIEVSKNPKKFVPKAADLKRFYLIKSWKGVATDTERLYRKLLGHKP